MVDASPPRWRLALLGTWAALATAACTGHLGGGEPAADTMVERSPQSSWVPAPPSSSACETPRPLEAPLRRLTAAQYRRALEAIAGPLELEALPDDGAPAGAFADDVNRLGVDPDMLEAILEDAERAAAALLASDAPLAPCLLEAVDRDCAATFLAALATEAYRRPATDDEVAGLLAIYDREAAEADAQIGLEAAATVTLVSPPFLYRVERGDPAREADGVRPLTRWELASRLSFLYTGGPPDAALRARVEAGELDDPADAAAVARSLVYDDDGVVRPVAREAFADFFRGWLGLDRLDALPEGVADADLVASLREEIHLFLDAIVWDEGGSVEELLTAGFTYVDERLAQHYGLATPGEGFAAVEDASRAGLLSQGAFSILAAGTPSDSPIHRGAFLGERFACVHFGDPPENADEVTAAMPADLDPIGRAAVRADEPSCRGCHDTIDPLGLGLSHLDALGRPRDAFDGGSPIALSVPLQLFDVDTTITGVDDVAVALAGSDHVAACASAWMFRFAVARVPEEADACSVYQMAEANSFVEQWLSLAADPRFSTLAVQEDA